MCLCISIYILKFSIFSFFYLNLIFTLSIILSLLLTHLNIFLLRMLYDKKKNIILTIKVLKLPSYVINILTQIVN